MLPQEQALARQAISAGGNAICVSTNLVTGEKRVIFDSKNLTTSGDVVFSAFPSPGQPGTLDMSLVIYTEPDHTAGCGATLGMLYPQDLDGPNGDQAQQKQQEQDDDLAAVIPGAKVVTNKAAMTTRAGEPPLGAYLRAFADQTKLTVLAHWPKTSTDPLRRMPQSLVKKPAADALNLLCKAYHAEWVRDGKVVRLRAVSPTPTVPPAVPAPVSAATAAPTVSGG